MEVRYMGYAIRSRSQHVQSIILGPIYQYDLDGIAARAHGASSNPGQRVSGHGPLTLVHCLGASAAILGHAAGMRGDVVGVSITTSEIPDDGDHVRSHFYQVISRDVVVSAFAWRLRDRHHARLRRSISLLVRSISTPPGSYSHMLEVSRELRHSYRTVPPAGRGTGARSGIHRRIGR
jgi:hypothetical protein